MNYSVLGNQDTYLHAHVHARYDWEPPGLVTGPVACYPADIRNAPSTLLGPQHDQLCAELTEELDRLTLDYVQWEGSG